MSNKKTSSPQEEKIEKIKTGKATTGGAKNKNIGGQSGSTKEGKGDTSGSKGTSNSLK